MHNTTKRLSAPTGRYRERLSPSLWVLVSAAVTAPMAALVFVPVAPTLALLAGVVVAVAVTAGLVWSSPTIAVGDGELRIGRAHVPVGLLGDPQTATGDQARQLRGPGLSRNAWHLLRPGIEGLVRVPLHDPADPVTEWVFSTRTPERVAAAIRREQSA